VPLPIQKSAAKLGCCRFRNQHQTMSLPIRKSVASNCAVADSEIGSPKLCCCWFWNWQPSTVPLPRNRQQKLCRCRSRNRQRRWSRFSLALFFLLGVYNQCLTSFDFKFHQQKILRTQRNTFLLYSFSFFLFFFSLTFGNFAHLFIKHHFFFLFT